MLSLRHLTAALLLLVAVVCAPTTVHAAESYDNCTGFINSLPTTITTQGVWCMNKNLSTAITSGSAITIAANNVTIDCNDFKIGGLAAGDSSNARGIYANGRQNATVRQCAIRGFRFGIRLRNGAGHLVEDNRLDNNLYAGIDVSGDNNRVQRNRVYDTGGHPGTSVSFGITAYGDVIDNTVAGVYATATNSYAYGIQVNGSGSEARGNQVRGLVAAGTGGATGIYAGDTGIRLSDNHLSGASATAGRGIVTTSANTFCTGNTAVNFDTAYYGCDHTFGNLPSAP